MATDTHGISSFRRPRPLLLVLLAAVIVGVLLMRLGGSVGSGQPSSSPARPAQQRNDRTQKLDPAALDVKLEALAGDRPGPGETARNPFRFQSKAPPAPPPSADRPQASQQAGPPQPAPPPPITVKFIGTLELPQGGMVAIFTDCSVGRASATVREGGTILGQYRLVKIGLQSVIVEHLDGRGRTTLAKTGQECVK